MGGRKNLKEIRKNAEHYKALGETEIYIDEDDPDLPWNRVTKVIAGGAVRLSGPTGCYFVAQEDGLTLKWPVDFEARESNGSSTHLFDRERLRSVMDKLTVGGRYLFASFLAQEVMPAVLKCSAEWRSYLNRQLDSEDCLRGLIAYGEASKAA